MPSGHVHSQNGEEPFLSILLLSNREDEVGMSKEVGDPLEHGPRFEYEGRESDLEVQSKQRGEERSARARVSRARGEEERRGRARGY